MKLQQATFAELPALGALAPLAAIAPQLVLVFGSVRLLSAEGLLARLHEAFGSAELAGCTTAGEISDDGVSDERLVITALHFEHPGFRVVSTALAGMADSAAAGRRLADQLAAPGLHNVLVFGQGVNINGSALIEGFRQGLAPEVALSGGLAGDGGAFTRSYTLSSQAVSSEQIVAIGFTAPELQLRHGCFHGWQPFGPARKVTRCEGNVLHELDGAPALEVYKKYLGEYARDLPGSGLLFPFEMLGQDHHAVGLIRTILGVDEAAGSLILAGDIVQDGYLKLMHATTDSLVDGAHEAAAAAGVDNAAAGCSLALLVSCVGRKLVMGARVDEEVESVAEVFGRHAHVTGFYSNGEISPALASGSGGECHLHNQTMTITHLSERHAV
ncbi:FIST N-terminal domain-containing protein [Paucibacter sp. APW11]|uniref:FIST N-terminal domain-containing protein n=1 Tax=Roseateles aquae TaxID=3077235 RepID=A0ABU3PE03_9BURK|nr:FIST N-terminal domain-containing protein [Paucibacter sp. APW11]MDT9000788.1 FIST N-terminal domain-containing protein [Paucibacter sp. APW11]